MRRPRPERGTLLGWALGALAFAYLLALPPTLNTADESFLLYGAKRVHQGDALYRDFFDFLMPGSFYLYACAYAVGGVSIATARVTSALLNALTVVCAYFLTLHVASRGEAVLAALLVVAICVPAWNMASHHWLATAFGMAMAAVLLAPRWRESSRARPAAAGALGGALMVTHQGRGLPLVLWLVLVTVATALRAPARRGRRCVTELVWTAVGGAAVCIPVLAYAVWHASFAEMLYATYTWVTTNYREYNVGKTRWAGYGAFWAASARLTWLWFAEAVPAMLAVEGAAIVWATWRRGMAAQQMRLTVFTAALAAVAGIAYFPDVVHVAFVMPFAIVVAAGMVHRLRTAPVWCERPLARAVVRLAWVAALVVVLLKAWTNARFLHDAAPLRVETAFGTLAASKVHAGVLHDLREALHVDPSRPARLFSHSTDAWIYLALPADNPTRYALLRPRYNTTEQIREVIERLDADRAAVVLVNRVSLKQDDPVLVHLRASWPRPIPIGPPVFLGGALYELYRRDPPS